MKTKKIIRAVLFFVLPFCSFLSFADKVTLQSGSFLIGEAGVFDGDKLMFTSDEFGEIALPIEKIVSLETDKKHVIRYQDLSKEEKILSVVNGEIVVVENNTTTKLGDVKDIDHTEETWHGSFNVSATSTRGNTIGETVSVIGSLSRRWERDRFTSSAGYYYAATGDSKETKQKTMSRLELQAQEDHFWAGDSFYTYVNGKGEYDRIMLLEYRARFGLGLGYQWFEKKDLGFLLASFNQELGMTYLFEKYDTTERDDYATLRYAHHFSADFTCVDGLSFVHNFELLPELNEWQDNYLIDADIGFTYAFRDNWQLIAKAEWDYKKKVAKETKHSDIRYILGVGYTW